MSELKQPWRGLYSQLHFGDGRHFDSHLGGRNVDVDYYMRFAGPGIKLLDLGSGTGRFAIPAAKKGSRVTGVDFLPTMMKVAKAKAAEQGADVEWIEGDFLTLDLPGGFDVVIAPFNFLAQFPAGALTGLLKRIRPLLRKDGKLVFDVVNPDVFRAASAKPPVLRYDSPDGRGSVSLAMEIKVVGDEIHGLQRYEFEDGAKHIDEIRLAAITSDVIRDALKAAGFEPGKWLGGFAGKEFAPDDSIRIVETAPAAKRFFAFIDDDGMKRSWYTERLWELAKALPVKTVPIASIPAFDEVTWFGYDEPTCRRVTDHAKRIQQADLQHPIILSAEGYVMDGMHRICKAHLLEMTTIQAVRFPTNPEPDECVKEAKP